MKIKIVTMKWDKGRFYPRSKSCLTKRMTIALFQGGSAHKLSKHRSLTDTMSSTRSTSSFRMTHSMQMTSKNRPLSESLSPILKQK